MSASSNRTTDEAAIRELVESWARAVRAKDFDGILANHSADMLMFDVPPPVQSKALKRIGRLGICSFLGLMIRWSLISKT
jgi:ketosteroid isomerase-like protein